MNFFYLDTCIFVTLFTDEDRRDVVVQAMANINQIEDAVFVTSDFTFVEMAKVLINTKKHNPKATAKGINKITKSRSIDGFDFTILPTSPSPKYTFDKFWADVGQNMNLYNPGWGDSMHCVIMKNNDVENILSLDAKHDFELVPGINLFHPEDMLESIE